MSDLNTMVAEFLALKRIAVVGVSRTKTEAANAIYRKLRTRGYEVFPVNPNAAEVEGDNCYPNLGSIPGGVEGVVIATHPDVALDVVEQCLKAGVSHVWMHRSFGTGSVSAPAVERCKESRISVIPGGCPMMFCEPVDLGHKCIRWILRLSGGLPTAMSGGEQNPNNGWGNPT
jgi:predicted CoA-binding protein